MAVKKSKTKQLGNMLIEKNLLTQEQLDAALEVQLKEGGLLGQILVKLGFVTKEQIENSISEQTDSAQKLENVLMEMGIISSEQLVQAKEIQNKQSGLLSKILINLGFLSEEDLVSNMVTQFGFPYLQLTNYEIDAEIVKLVPKETALKYYLIPIDQIGNILTLSMADPLNAAAQDEIRKITALNVETFISTFSDINNAIEKYYV
ncbi:MAG: hypothetical protein KKH34_02575 [Candidatus Omnitrophica bacterium]|nr:hypothetical protein [Candidatus Omnitrophota bacterium]MCG2704130.1 hypothetical protein [Candidatus Omnitrophota bacterium]